MVAIMRWRLPSSSTSLERLDTGRHKDPNLKCIDCKLVETIHDLPVLLFLSEVVFHVKRVHNSAARPNKTLARTLDEVKLNRHPEMGHTRLTGTIHHDIYTAHGRVDRYHEIHQ